MDKMTSPAVVQLEIGQEEAIGHFLRRHYGDGFYGADPAYFSWLFMQSPCHWFAPQRDEGKLPANAVLTDSGEIGALHTFVPFDVITPWGGRVGVWDLDWINGTGIPGAGRALARHLLQGVDIYAGFGCNDLSENAFKRMGMDVVAEAIPRCVVMLARDTLMALSMSSGIPFRVDDYPQDQPKRNANWYALSSVDEIPEDLLTAPWLPSALSVSRSRQWLEWRYEKHPYISYQIIAADVAGVNGVAFVRLENVVGTDHRVCRVLDLISRQKQDAALLAAVVAYAQEQHCLLVDYFTSSLPVGLRWQAAGKNVGIEVGMNPRVPFMFQPLAVSDRTSINMVLSRGGRIPAGYPVDLAQFHATKADANQDILRSPETAAKLVRLK